MNDKKIEIDEEQGGLLAKRWYMNNIFSVKQIMEKRNLKTPEKQLIYAK